MELSSFLRCFGCCDQPKGFQEKGQKMFDFDNAQRNKRTPMAGVGIVFRGTSDGELQVVST